MSSTSEQGHKKNVDNLQDMINVCITFGASYQPSRADIQILALQGIHTLARTELDNVLAHNTTIENIINHRREKFGMIPNLATRLINALDASGANDAIVRDAKTHLNKIRGKRANTPAATNPDGTPVVTISVSQRSFDKMIEHFKALVALAISDTNYSPNEVDLQASSLNAVIADLEASNSEQSAASAQLSAALIARNAVLYTPNTGLCDIASEVKKYVKSVFGAQSPQYKLVSKIQFSKRKL